jgi:hypothetical protein
VAELADRGQQVDCRSVWEFVHAEKLSFKTAWWLANAIAPAIGACPACMLTFSILRYYDCWPFHIVTLIFVLAFGLSYCHSCYIWRLPRSPLTGRLRLTRT